MRFLARFALLSLSVLALVAAQPASAAPPPEQRLQNATRVLDELDPQAAPVAEGVHDSSTQGLIERYRAAQREDSLRA